MHIPAECDSVIRRTRFLETFLLSRIFLYSNTGKGQDDNASSWQEDLIDELALNYSIDVQMSDKFSEWLHRLRPTSLLALEILGLLDGEDDLDEIHFSHDRVDDLPGLVGKRSCISRDDPTTCSTRSDKDHGSTTTKKRISFIRRDSNGPAVSGVIVGDPRYHVEVKRTPTTIPPSTLSKNPQSHRSEKSASQRQSKTDCTIILATPPRNSSFSRSSTPGCSEHVQRLSLADAPAIDNDKIDTPSTYEDCYS